MANASETSVEVIAMIIRAKTWPSAMPQWFDPATKRSMAAFSMISIPISSIMILERQISTQISPRENKIEAKMSRWVSGTIMVLASCPNTVPRL